MRYRDPTQMGKVYLLPDGVDRSVPGGGAGEMGPMANNMIDIGRPDLDWVRLSEGMGVPATRATTADEFVTQFRAAVSQAGPALIEAVLKE